MKSTKVIIQTKDNYSLEAIHFQPESTKGCVQINSGTGIPKEFYQNFALYCAEQGYATVIFDYRGIGGSKPKSLRGFEATNRDWGMRDASDVFQWLNDRYPGLRKTVIGHSMGGQLVGLMENNDKADNIIMLGSGTGYWKDMPSGTLKMMTPFLWYFYVPVTTSIYGYATAKKLRQGENLPKGVAMEWRNWCVNDTYWERDFGKTIDQTSFTRVTAPITSYSFDDDKIISKTATEKLLRYFPNASITKNDIAPGDFGIQKFGHFGFFSKRSKSMWEAVIS